MNLALCVSPTLYPYLRTGWLIGISFMIDTHNGISALRTVQLRKQRTMWHYRAISFDRVREKYDQRAMILLRGMTKRTKIQNCVSQGIFEL